MSTTRISTPTPTSLQSSLASRMKALAPVSAPQVTAEARTALLQRLDGFVRTASTLAKAPSLTGAGNMAPVPVAARPAPTEKAGETFKPSELFKAFAPPKAAEAAPEEPEWTQPTDFVSQLAPEGAKESRYGNAKVNCGPAVAAMLARSLGQGEGLSDAELVKQLSAGLTDAKTGTSLEDMHTMLGELPLDVNETRIGYDSDWAQQQLTEGNKLVALVDNEDLEKGQGGHYVLIDGLTADGKYKVMDPKAQGPQELTRAQFEQNYGLLDGVGMLTSVSPKGEPRAPEAAVAPTLAGPQQPATQAEEEPEFTTGATAADRPSDGKAIPDEMTPEQYAHSLTDRLLSATTRSERRQAFKDLRELEASWNHKDKQVWGLVKHVMGHLSGGGQKVEVDPFVREWM